MALLRMTSSLKNTETNRSHARSIKGSKLSVRRFLSMSFPSAAQFILLVISRTPAFLYRLQSLSKSSPYYLSSVDYKILEFFKLHLRRSSEAERQVSAVLQRLSVLLSLKTSKLLRNTKLDGATFKTAFTFKSNK